MPKCSGVCTSKLSWIPHLYQRCLSANIWAPPKNRIHRECQRSTGLADGVVLKWGWYGIWRLLGLLEGNIMQYNAIPIGSMSCYIYLPIYHINLAFMIHAGKYTSPIECLGYISTFPVECFMGSQISASAICFLNKIRKTNTLRLHPFWKWKNIKLVAVSFCIMSYTGKTTMGHVVETVGFSGVSTFESWTNKNRFVDAKFWKNHRGITP